MILGAAVLLGLALSAPVRSPAVKVDGQAARVRAAPAQQAPAACSRYRVQAEENDLVGDAEVAAWTTAALARVALLDATSPCFVHVRITAGPISTRGRQDGFVAHVSTSTRRFLRDGKLVTREKGLLVVQTRREEVVPRVREFVEDFVAGLATTAAPGPEAAPAPDGGPRAPGGG